jgi:hypothetical protein
MIISHTRQKTRWPIVFLILAALSCNFPGQPAPSSAPSPTTIPAIEQTAMEPVQGETPAEPIQIQAGQAERLASGSAGPQGGSVSVSAPGTPLDGFTIQAPAGAYTKEVGIEVSAAPILSHNLDPGLQVLTPLIQVEAGDVWAEDFMQLRLPLQLDPGQFAMLFIYDPEYGRLDALPLAAEDETHLIALTTHFSFMLGIAVDKAELDGLNLKTGFVQGRDNWQFTNFGSYISPDGHCSGQSVTAMDYFLFRRSGQLYGKYDPYNNAHPATLNLQLDDRAGYRLASVVQEKMDWGSWQRRYWTNVQSMDPELSYYAFALALRASGEPQYVAVHGASGGHALILYEKYGDRFYVSDPNFLAPTARRAIVFDRSQKKFKPYYSGPNASATGIPYEQIYYMNKYSMMAPNRLASYWTQMENGTIGSDLFPEYELFLNEVDESGIPGFGQVVTSRITVADSQLEIGIDAPEFQAKVEVFDERLQKIGSFDRFLEFELPSPTRQSSYLFVIWGWKNGKWKWVDGRWMTIVRSYAGSWDSGPLCNESFETRYRWSVALLQDEAGNITGTIHFHNCPDGGQAYYRVTGHWGEAGGLPVLDGVKVNGAGTLGASAPATQRFTIERGQPPQPNLAP